MSLNDNKSNKLHNAFLLCLCRNAVAVTPHLVAAGFFDDQLLPRMLSDTMSRAW